MEDKTKQLIKDYTQATNEHFETMYYEGYHDGFSEGYDNALEVCKVERVGAIDRSLEEGYNKGLEDAWECVKKIHNLRSNEERARVFGKGMGLTLSIIEKLSVHEAMERLKADKTFQVGDEVKEINTDDVFVVTMNAYELLDGTQRVQGISECGTVHCGVSVDDIVPTGRHFPQIADAMKEMRDGKTVPAPDHTD